MEISQVAKKSGVSASTLRFYEEKGLIKSIGRQGIRRVFSSNVLERLELIALGRAAGFSLEEIAGILGTDAKPDIDRDLLLKKANELDETIKKLEGLFADKDIQTRTIWGEVPADEEEDEDDNRPKRIDEWRESGDINVLIANPATLAESVSLHQECHHAIYVDRTFNGGHYMQSLERIHRVGLVPDTVTKYDIIQAELSIDQIISERLEFKRENMNRFLESADLAVMRFQDEANAANFANPIGEDRELDSDFAATMEHVKKDVHNI